MFFLDVPQYIPYQLRTEVKLLRTEYRPSTSGTVPAYQELQSHLGPSRDTAKINQPIEFLGIRPNGCLLLAEYMAAQHEIHSLPSSSILRTLYKELTRPEIRSFSHPTAKAFLTSRRKWKMGRHRTFHLVLLYRVHLLSTC